MVSMKMTMTIREAALHLNVSTNTIRRRLQVGLLTGSKVGGKWMIDVAKDGATPGHPQQDPEPSPPPTPDRPQQEPEPPTLVHTLQSRIDSMELELESRMREIDSLESQLESRMREIEQIQYLAANSPNAPQRKPWWAFWR